MKISYNWLKELVPELNKTPSEVAELFTLHSFETVVAGEMKIDPKVTVARITKIAPHPNADRLKLATVATEREEITVVCGAPNIHEGDVVPYAPPGTTLRDEEGKEVTLASTAIRGVASPGMLNSPRELGLSDWHGGIYILPPDTPLGTPLSDHIPADTILEADITPNRAHDCLSHRGLAYELAALLELTVKEPEQADTSSLPALPQWKVNITDSRHTPRYKGTLLTNIQVGPSPLWLQARLWAVGARPINNVVDSTNYILFEMGNPTHAFDAAFLPRKKIEVRFAKAGESLTALDGNTYQVHSKNLLITSDKPVAIAGIIGGADTQVTDKTTEVFLEAATFNAFAILESSAALKIRTESSIRFSKELHPALVSDAAGRAVYLLQLLASAAPAGVIEHYPKPPAKHTFSFRPERVSSVAGMTIASAKALSSLIRLRCEVKENRDAWQVTPPIERLDLSGEHDLIEEVIRLIGLEKIETVAPEQKPVAIPGSIVNREQIRDHLVKAGFIEVYNFSFEAESVAGPLGLIHTNALELINPVAADESHLRVSLLPRLLINLVTNKAEIRKKESPYSKSLFEIGAVFSAGSGGIVKGVREDEHVAGVSIEKTIEELKEVVSVVVGQGTWEERNDANEWEAPYYVLKINNHAVATVGILSTKRRLALPQRLLREAKIAAFEVSIS